jgi:hypothetical protein
MPDSEGRSINVSEDATLSKICGDVPKFCRKTAGDRRAALPQVGSPARMPALPEAHYLKTSRNWLTHSTYTGDTGPAWEQP